jgi:hypothetical protein
MVTVSMDMSGSTRRDAGGNMLQVHRLSLLARHSTYTVLTQFLLGISRDIQHHPDATGWDLH